MRVDGNVVFYLLARAFDDVSGHVSAHGALVDFPLLYDGQSDMSGHTVIVPEGVIPVAGPHMKGVVCVCVSEESSSAAIAAGLDTILVNGVPWQLLANHMHASFAGHTIMDAQLHAQVEAFAGFQALLDTCSRAMDCTCVLIDANYRLICEADAPSEGEGMASYYLDDEAIDLFMASRDYGRMRTTRKVFVMPGSGNLLMKNIFSGDELVGMLVMLHDGSSMHARYIHFLLDYLAAFVESMYARLGAFATTAAEARQIHAMLERALNGGAIDFAALDGLLAAEGNAAEHADAPGSYVLLRFERSFTYEGASGLDVLGGRIELAWPHVHCAVAGDGLFALARLDTQGRDSEADFLQGVTTFARDMLAKVGVSRPFSSCVQLMGARLQATAALMQGEAVDPTSWFYRFDDYALAWLVEHGRHGAAADSVAHRAVVALACYDAERGTELVHTLRVFMESRYNATDAAERLFVARSTLLNRLARIEELTHIDLDSLEERIYLGISLALL